MYSRVLIHIDEKLEKMNGLKRKELELKDKELKQNKFFIELIEECLPLTDAQKRSIHQRTMRGFYNDY